MSATTCQDAAHHESGHATILAVRTQILTDNLSVGCRPDGVHPAGLSDAPRIPLTEMSAVNWIIYNFAGHAAERLFNPTADRNTALRDDMTAEKVLRTTFHHEWWTEVLDEIEQATLELVQTHQKCIQELAGAILAVPPRTVTVLGEEYHIRRLSAPQVAEVLRNNGIQTSKQFGSDAPDAMVEKVLERNVTVIRLFERSPFLATEFRNWRRFSEMKLLYPTNLPLDHQIWLDYFATTKAEIVPDRLPG
jgi:hypothetical protein